MDFDMHTAKLVLYGLNVVLSFISVLTNEYKYGWGCSCLGWLCAFINEI